MNIDLRLNDFPLPRCIESDKDYYGDLKKWFDRYTEHIENITGIAQECKKKINENCQLILKSILQYYDANIIDAEQCIEGILEKYVNYAFIVAPISENYAFRGISPEKIRPSIYAEQYRSEYERMMETEIYFFRSRISEKRLERKDMLHIPFDNRGIIWKSCKVYCFNVII